MELNIAYEMNKLFPDWEIDGQYMSIDYHRNGDPEKSQWSIPVEEEFISFAISKRNKWFDGQRGWGVHPSMTFLDVGYLNNGKNVQIVRFQEMSPHEKKIQNKWHGYPADIKGKTNDIPILSVLNNWRELGMIQKHHLSKIRRGVL